MPASCLSGDTGQHASVVRGDALRILENHSNFQSGQLTRIRRQRKAEYRKAVELAAQKRTAEAFAQLERMRCRGGIFQTTTCTTRRRSRI
ncbi:MAG: AAA family ATPase [Verrucomicrobiota bacterium]